MVFRALRWFLREALSSTTLNGAWMATTRSRLSSLPGQTI